jgi:hypothetical protein
MDAGSLPAARDAVRGLVVVVVGRAARGGNLFAAGYGLRWLMEEPPVRDVSPISPERFLNWWMDGRPLRDD